MLPTIAIISPCFNEEAVLMRSILEFQNALNSLINKKSISDHSFIAFIDDGSLDATWEIITNHSQNSKLIKGLKLSTNVGHQNALLAGLLEFKSQADALISIDADLQDDISVLEEMVLKHKNGCDVVYGVRKKRKKDSFFKRNSALIFYKIMKKIKVNLVYNHSDYRLCSKRVLNALEQYNEVNLFLRGIIPTIGFKSDVVYYNRLERKAGTSKYSLYKMISFAWNGITSFSNFPLKLVTIIGFAIFIFCFVMSVFSLSAMYLGNVIPGWVSTVLPMYFLGGVQLFCFGIIGEYIGKIYSEVKRRPRYFIEKKID